MTAFDRAEEIAAWLGNLHPHQGPDDSCAIRDRIMSAIHEEKRELSEKLQTAQRDAKRFDEISDRWATECARQRARAMDAELQLGEVTAHRDRLRDMLNDIRGMILAARTVHEISELACLIMRRIEGAPQDVERRLCSGGTCQLEEGHDGDHVVNLRRRCICPNGTRTAIAHVNGCPAGGG